MGLQMLIAFPASPSLTGTRLTCLALEAVVMRWRVERGGTIIVEGPPESLQSAIAASLRALVLADSVDGLLVSVKSASSP